MLEIAEVGAKVSKEEYEESLPPLRVDLLNAEFQVRGSDLPVMIVLSGDDREAVSEVLNLLHHWMDARYLQGPRAPISALLALLAGPAGKGRDRDLCRRLWPGPAG
jgi:hypothetical protein